MRGLFIHGLSLLGRQARSRRILHFSLLIAFSITFPIVLALAQSQGDGNCGYGYGYGGYGCSTTCDAYSVVMVNGNYTVQCDSYSVQCDGYSGVGCDGYSTGCDAYGGVGCDGYSGPTDQVPPVVTEVWPSGTLFRTPGNVIVNYYDPEPSSGLGPFSAYFQVDGNGPSYCVLVDPFSSHSGKNCMFPGLTAGHHVITGSVTDNAGNSTPISGSFDIASIPIQLADDPSGGECGLIGSWDAASKTCTMDRDMEVDNNAIEIVSDGITLDGNGHTIADVFSGPAPYEKGVSISNRDNVTVRNLALTGFTNGIILDHSTNSNIIANSAEYTNAAFVVYASSGNNVVENEAITCGMDIGLKGLTLDQANNNTVTNNRLTSCGTGLFMFASAGNVLRNNQMNANGFNFSLAGRTDAEYINDIDTSNSVNGKPIYYVLNAAGQVFGESANAGVFYCVNCSNVTIERQRIQTNGVGIFLRGTDAARVQYNYLEYNGEGLHMEESAGNTIAGNDMYHNRWAGLDMQNSDGNRVYGNDIFFQSAVYGFGAQLADSSNNLVYNNRFLSNTTQAQATGGGGNVFNLPAPVGGNYWSGWTSPDSDLDGFVDSPYMYDGGYDYLPWASDRGWCDIQSLTLSVGNVYWGSYGDYQANLLSIDFHIDSFFDVGGLEVTGVVNSNGVTLATPMTLVVGDMEAGGRRDFTLRYEIPAGTKSFRTTTYMQARDSCGNLDYYPGPLPW